MALAACYLINVGMPAPESARNYHPEKSDNDLEAGLAKTTDVCFGKRGKYSPFSEVSCFFEKSLLRCCQMFRKCNEMS
jgi:hypothetical protein